MIERGANRAPKPARGKPPDGFIDGNDAAYLQRLRRFLFRTALARIARIPQNFKLWLNHLQFASTLIFLDFAIQRDHLPGREPVLQVRCIKPKAAKARPPLSNGELENRDAPGAEQSGASHLADHRGHLAGAQLGNPARIQPVFVAKRQIMQQVANRVDTLGGENLPDARTYALRILDRSGKFEHVRIS